MTSTLPTVPGFRASRPLGGNRWVAHESSVDRWVMLERITEPWDPASVPEHPGVARLFTIVESATDRIAVFDLPPDALTFAQRAAAGASPRQRHRWLATARQVVSSVRHGSLTADDILVGADGAVLLVGFGRSATTSDDDRLAALEPPVWRRRLGGTLGVVALVLAASTGLWWSTRPPTIPAVLDGTIALGSNLAASPTDTPDCATIGPGGASTTCTVMQTTPAGGVVDAPAGTVKQWVLRGFEGRVQLLAMIPLDGGWERVTASPIVVADGGIERVEADFPVVAGTRFGVHLLSGSRAGVNAHDTDARFVRFAGVVSVFESTLPATEPGQGTLLLRVDVLPDDQG